MKKASKILCFFLVILSLAAVLSAGCFASGKTKVIELKYDDFYDLSDYDKVEISDKGKPESCKVGYGVKSGTKDDAVFEVVDGYIHATGTGDGKIILDGNEYTVKVEPAPISMFLMLGQSNMYGSDGERDQSVVNENGQAYSTFFHPEGLVRDDADKYIPSALSGDDSLISRAGTKEDLSISPLNRLTEAGKGKPGFDSGFAYEYNRLTGDKVWTVNLAKGATAMRKWQRGAVEYETAVALFSEAQKLMREEIEAGHYILKDYGYLWCQGCSDRINTAEYYVEAFLSMHKSLLEDLAFDIDGDGKKETLEFCHIIMPRKGGDDVVGYRHGINCDEDGFNFFTTFRSLEMSGPRVAQYWLANNPSYPEINLVCNIGEKWVTMPDGSDGVRSYFEKHYKDGRVDYPIQVPQPEEWYSPKTPEDVHDNMHFNQIGYNEAGFETARNTAYLRNRVEKPSGVKPQVTFYDWTGCREISSVAASDWADSRTLVVPVVYPVYESKNVTYKLSKNLSYSFYDLTSDYLSNGGALVSSGAAVNKKVTVIGKTDVKEGGAAYSFESGNSTLVSVSSEGYQSNGLKIVRGSVTEAVHKGVVYQIEKKVNLKKENKWIVEWTGKSTSTSASQQSFVLLSGYIKTKNIATHDTDYIQQKYTRNKSISTMVGLSKKRCGGYVVSGASAAVNPDEYHTYTLWNEPLPDGKNKVHFAVDGKWIGELKNASGRDFTFGYIGSEGYEINDYIFKDIRIIESASCSKYGHSIVHKTTKATCTAKGSLEEKCMGCSYKISAFTKALSHNYSDKYVSDNNATYSKDGTKSTECSKCGAKKTVTDKGSKLVLGRTSKITVDGKGKSVTLTWNKCKDATGYRVYIRENSSWKQLKIVTSTTYTVTGLKPMQNYTFAVKAYVKENGKAINAPTYRSVAVCSGLEATVVSVASTAAGRATVAWKDVSGEAGYQVWYSSSEKGNYKKLSNYNADTVKIYETGLKSNNTYYFKVRAYAKDGKTIIYSDFSNVKSLKIK